MDSAWFKAGEACAIRDTRLPSIRSKPHPKLRLGALRLTSAVYRGSGISSASGSVLTVTSSTFSTNASRVGGAIDNNDGAVSITDSTFVSNSALQSGVGAGGAIHNGGLAGSVTIHASLIARNWTDGDGGAIYHGSGSLTISRSTLAGNWSECAIGGCVGGGGSSAIRPPCS